MTFLDVRTSKVKAEEQFKYEVCIYNEGGRDEEERGGKEGRNKGEKVGFNSQTFLNSTKRLDTVVKSCINFH